MVVGYDVGFVVSILAVITKIDALRKQNDLCVSWGICNQQLKSHQSGKSKARNTNHFGCVHRTFKAKDGFLWWLNLVEVSKKCLQQLQHLKWHFANTECEHLNSKNRHTSFTRSHCLARLDIIPVITTQPCAWLIALPYQDMLSCSWSYWPFFFLGWPHRTIGTFVVRKEGRSESLAQPYLERDALGLWHGRHQWHIGFHRGTGWWLLRCSLCSSVARQPLSLGLWCPRLHAQRLCCLNEQGKE